MISCKNDNGKFFVSRVGFEVQIQGLEDPKLMIYKIIFNIQHLLKSHILVAVSILEFQDEK